MYVGEARSNLFRIISDNIFNENVASLKLTGFAVKQRSDFTIEKISFNATYFGERAVRSSELVYADLIIAYMQLVANSNNSQLQPTVKRIPYTKVLSSTTTWTIDVIYDDYSDPLNKMLECGALNNREIAHITVNFASDDLPYFNRGVAGYFYILLSLPNGAQGVILIK